MKPISTQQRWLPNLRAYAEAVKMSSDEGGGKIRCEH
jgi:hypothetical protein